MMEIRDIIALAFFPTLLIAGWLIARSNTAAGRALREWGRRNAEVRRRRLSGH